MSAVVLATNTIVVRCCCCSLVSTIDRLAVVVRVMVVVNVAEIHKL